MSKSLTQQFTDWVRTKPRDEEYDYVDVCGCPFARFLREVKWTPAIASPCSWLGLRWFIIPWFGNVPEEIDDAACSAGPRTFGALADRLALNQNGGGA